MCGVCRGRAGNMPMVPPPYVCTACQQVLPVQDVARHLARCEPSGRELDLVARESVRRLVAERILHLENLLPPLYHWSQPGHGLPVDDMLLFFQSDYPSVSIDDFASHEAADFWIRKNLGGDQVARGFSADAYIVQRGDVFSVVVSKTRFYFDFLLQGFFDSQQELAALRQYTF